MNNEISSVSGSNQRISKLEGLRGLAALVVVFHHFAYIFYPTINQESAKYMHSEFERIIRDTPLNILFCGNFAVCIFFVLSGYVLSYAYFQSGDLKKLQAFALKRYPRLMLPVLASVMLAWVIHFCGLFNLQSLYAVTKSRWLEKIYTFQPDFTDMLYQGTIGIFLSVKNNYYNNVIWSMHYEMLGSFMIFAFLALFGQLRRRWVLYLLLAPFTLGTFYLAFLLGLVLCDYRELISAVTAKHRRAIIIVTLISGLLLGSYGEMLFYGKLSDMLKPWKLDTLARRSAFQIPGAALVFVAVMLSQNSKLLQNKFSLFLGRISYSLYLTHLLILLTVGIGCFSIFHKSFEYHSSALLSFCISIPLTLIVAVIFNKYVDRIAVSLSKRIASAIFQS